MRLSDEQRELTLVIAAGIDLTNVATVEGLNWEPQLAALALDLADELAAIREEAETQFMANADVIRSHEQTRKELAAAQRREKRLKRQVELMGDLLDSRGDDVERIGGILEQYVRDDELAEGNGYGCYDSSVRSVIMKALRIPSFSDMGDLADYTDDDLDMLKDHWPDAAKELDRRQMAADNHGSTRDGDAERDYWGSR